jgi:hypothetical protein
MQSDNSRGAQHSLTEPSHPEQKEQDTDYKLKGVYGNKTKERAEDEHKACEQDKPRSGTEHGGSPALECAHSQHNGEGFNDFHE